MDTYSEQLVKKTQTSSDSMKKILIIIVGAIVVVGLLYVTFAVTAFALLAVAAAVYGIYWFITGTNVEYEYIVTNGSMDIDKIISKRKRVNLLSVEIKDFTDFGEYQDQSFDATVILAVGGEEKLMYADFKDQQYGVTRLVFAPNEKTVKCIKPYLQRNIKFKN